MANKKFDFDLDEYDDDFDDIFSNKTPKVEKSSSVNSNEVSYQDFSQDDYTYEDSDNYDYSYDENDDGDVGLDTTGYSNESIMNYLSLFLVWFTRIGVGIMIILIAFYITNGNILGLVKYILLLVGAFFFGYFFMYFLDKRKENN